MFALEVVLRGCLSVVLRLFECCFEDCFEVVLRLFEGCFEVVALRVVLRLF